MGGDLFSYHSPRRQLQAEQTRVAVLRAAAESFADLGWGGTTVRDVARRAGVAVETVYAHYPSKSELLLAALDVSVVGDVAPVPLAERPEFAALASGSRRKRTGAAAALMAQIQQRSAGLNLALCEAATTSEEMAQRWRDNELRRQVSVEQAGALVIGRPLTPHERDALWAVLSVECYQLLTQVAGYTLPQYQSWVAHMIDRLLEDKPRRRGGA